MPKRETQAVSTSGEVGPVWEGGVKPLGARVEDQGKEVEAYTALWVDAEWGLVQSYRLFTMEESTDGGIGEVVAGLEEALSGVGMPLRGQARRPAVVRVRDEPLAAVLRSSGLVEDARVEVAAELSTLDSVAEQLAGFAGDLERPPAEPFRWKIEPSLLRPLYTAAAEFAARAPWTFMSDNPPIAVELGDYGPRKNARTVYACVLGNAGEMLGLAAYYSFAGYERQIESGLVRAGDIEELQGMLETLAEGDPAIAAMPPELVQAVAQEAARQLEGGPPMEDSMGMFFDPLSEHDPTYIRWLLDHTLPVASEELIPRFFRARRSGNVGNLSAREVEAMTLVLDCANTFVDTFRADLEPDASSLLETFEGQYQMGMTHEGSELRAWWPGDEYFLEETET
jgi:hypothetical protein